jgi:hypothetical protein
MCAVDYSQYLIKQPLVQDASGFSVKNMSSPPPTYLSSALVPGIPYSLEIGWVWGMPDPNPHLDMHSHTYDEIFLFIGADCRNPEDLGAEIEYTVGDQVLTTNHTSALFLPRGVPHGKPTWTQFSRPHIKISLAVGSSERKILPPGTVKPDKNADYTRCLVNKPAYEVVAGTPVKNRQGPTSMTLLNNRLVPGCNIYIEGGWTWGMPDPNPHIFEHVHDYEEIVVHFGTDYQHPEELGAEIEFWLGGQPLTVDRTSAIFVPRSVKHGPLVWKKYTAPHFEMAIMPGAGTLAQADPGGHQEKMHRRNKNG